MSQFLKTATVTVSLHGGGSVLERRLAREVTPHHLEQCDAALDPERTENDRVQHQRFDRGNGSLRTASTSSGLGAMRMTRGRISSTRPSSAVGTMSRQSSSATRLLKIAAGSRASGACSVRKPAPPRARHRARGNRAAQQVIGPARQLVDVAAGVLSSLAD